MSIGCDRPGAEMSPIYKFTSSWHIQIVGETSTVVDIDVARKQAVFKEEYWYTVEFVTGVGIQLKFQA